MVDYDYLIVYNELGVLVEHRVSVMRQWSKLLQQVLWMEAGGRGIPYPVGLLNERSHVDCVVMANKPLKERNKKSLMYTNHHHCCLQIYDVVF